jgi:DNA-binding transcriptional LysR family regulator
VLAKLRLLHPSMTVKLVASNNVHDLRRREADIALRSGRPTDPGLVATRLRDTPARLYATPAYMKRMGRPTTIAGLRHAHFIGFGDDDRFMAGLNALGFDLGEENFPLHATAHMVLWELVKSGLGIGSVIEEVGDVEPLVERVLPRMAPIPVPLWLVAHREVHTSRRVRVVFDLLAEHFAPRRPRSASKRAGKR